MSALPDQPQSDAFTPPIAIAADRPVHLCVDVDFDRLRFAFRVEGDAEWTWLPETFDASILSDEATAPGLPNFTGAFVGVACQDGSGGGCPADFAWFDYADQSTAAGEGFTRQALL
jgi:xylan 1,4-beta-xylosidase